MAGAHAAILAYEVHHSQFAYLPGFAQPWFLSSMLLMIL